MNNAINIGIKTISQKEVHLIIDEFHPLGNKKLSI